jgi:putative polyhydroxyalkanoate system protein
MSKISISRDHSLDHDHLITEVEHLADKLVEKYGGDYSWDGDELNYSYSGGVNACVQCKPDSVNVDVKLGMLMAMFKGPIAREIEDYLDKHIR